MVQLFRTDLQFIMDQILLAESGGTPPTPFHPWGLRTVTGYRNHLIPGQENWGAADNVFPRLLAPQFRPAGVVTIDLDDPEGQVVGQQTSYLQTKGFVFDAQPRLISNLIVDQTSRNPAAVEANGDADPVFSPGRDGLFGTADDKEVFFIPNVAPDEGLSAPFNSWFTLFGQFFDHGLDLVNKGGSGTVFIELQPDDPLYNDDLDGPDDILGTSDDAANFMMLTRATNRPGPDGIVGDNPATPFVDESADDIHEHNNQTTPFIDQNQTYTSHPSHQVFLREYTFNAAGDAVSTGRFLDGAQDGLAQWSDVKAQALTHLGIRLSDHDVHNVPLLMTDLYGKFIPGSNGYAQVAIRVGNGADGIAGNSDDIIAYVQGTAAGLDINNQAAINAALAGSGFSTGTVVRTNHAFLDDIAHAASPGTFDHDGNPATAKVNMIADGDNAVGVTLIANPNFNAAHVGAETLLLEKTAQVAVNPLFNAGQAASVSNRPILKPSWVYDNELLNAHFVTGDGRGNENIGLTAVHTIFHAEHNRLVQAIKDEVVAINDPVFTQQWVLPGSNVGDGVQDLEWNGERLFQAARVFTEMQYQHLVFEEFARKIQPSIDIFINIDMTINPAIFAEFAHVVYRFGHSMLTETIDRFDANFNVVGDGNPTEDGNQQIGLIAAFLNPLEFIASGADAADATAAVIRGMTRQSGNAIDEFVTEALRNNLVGLPLDLPALNIARGRDTGVPGLNDARRQFYAMTGDSQLTPYTSWLNFAENIKHPASVINFIAAYGTHDAVTSAVTMDDKREAATLLVMGDGNDADGVTIGGVTYFDRLDFVSGQGAYGAGANRLGGLDNVDLWIGGLAELAPAFGGMLGSTFAFVFETQMEFLQNGDRFYYLARFSGRNFLSELEGNSFATLIMRNTDLKHLPGDVFSTPNWTLEVDQSQQFTDLGLDRRDDPTWTDEGEPNNPFFNLVVRDNPNTVGPDTNYLRYNGGGHVVLGGTNDPDPLNDNDGNGADILIGSIGDDTIWGDGGNDRIEGGNGFDILNGGDGDDIITDLAFDDNIKGGDGNDVIHSGDGVDLVLGGRGNDFINIGTQEGEAFAGLGNDFVKSDGTLIGLIGGFGDDWLEAGFGNSFLTGDNSDVDGSVLNFGDNDPAGGHDVLLNRGGPTDFDSFAGDDIMLGGAGTERYEGFIGFDWASFQNQNGGAEADMSLRPVPHPGGDPNAVLDRFDNTEGLSGTRWADILRGDDRRVEAGLEPELLFTGHELTSEGIDRIQGLRNLLGAAIVNGQFTGGNIILGGGGSDLIEGRGGNDVIDGDAYLHVQIGIDRNNNGDFDDANERAYWMDEIEGEMLAGTLNPGQLGIVREILQSATIDTDTAVYSGNRVDYFVEGQDTVEGISDQNGDGFISVLHFSRNAQGVIIPGETGNDGLDFLRNIERLQFNDQQVTIFDTPNIGPVGQPVISDTTPEEGQTVTVDASGVTDPNNQLTNGVITGPITLTWQQQDGDTGLWSDILVLPNNDATEVPIPATGNTFTVGQDQAGVALRVRMTYVDERGTLETAFSAPTQPVAAVNDLPVGELLISDSTPTEGDLLTALIGFTDADGVHGAVFAFQWQSSADGINWTNAVGTVTVPPLDGSQFIPSQAEVGRFIRVVVTYTDDAGFDEIVISAATEVVGDVIVSNAATTNGTAGADRITGGTGNNTLNGLAGNDLLDGAAGIDVLNGGLGTDTLLGGGGGDTLNGGDGADTLNGQNGNDTVNGDGGDDVIIYNFGDGSDTINGGAGIDTININGTDGNDTLDVVFNGTSLSVIEGGNVQQVERVNATMRLGTDMLSYAATLAAVAVTVNLSTGIASGFTSFSGIENVEGGNGNDAIVGDALANVLQGNGGADTIEGGLGNDTMNGNAGDDTFLATLPTASATDGNDTIAGGGGTDTYSLANLNVGATINLVTGVASGGVIGTDTLSSIENATGGSGADILIANGGDNVLSGGGGDDQITGGAGNDVLNGGTGSDTFFYTLGADGADTINGGDDDDRIIVTGTGANNTLTVLVTGGVVTQLGGGSVSNVEAVLADLGAGTDTLSFDPAGAPVTTQALVVDLAAGTATGFSSLVSVENVTTGSGDDTVVGSAVANVINTGAGADVVTAGGGADTVNGGAGNDRFVATVGDGNDAYTGGDDSDTYDISGTTANATINIGASASSADIGTDTLNTMENAIGGSGNDSITGTGGANIIDGGAGVDTIDAGGGNDVITGGAGDDIMIGGTGNDRFVFAAGFGNDTIAGSATTRFDADGNGTLTNQDLIDVSAMGINAGNFAARVLIEDLGADTRITIDGVNTILLLGVSGDGANVITQADFLLGGP